MEEIEPEGGASYSAALGEHAGNPANPRTSGVPLVTDERTLTLATDEMRIKAQFEEWLKAGALLAIREAMQRNDPEEADNLRSVYLADMSARAFTWDGRNARAARKDWAGNTYLLFLMLNRCRPKVTLDECDVLMEDYPRECGDAMRAAQGNWPSVLAKAKRRTERERRRKERANGTPATGSAEPATMDQ